MTKLDELKAEIEIHTEAKKEMPELDEFYFDVGVSIKTLDTLIQIAEAAFEMPEPHLFKDGLECDICHGWRADWNGTLEHADDCAYKRIQRGKKELESVE